METSPSVPKETQDKPTQVFLDQLKLYFFNPGAFGKHLTDLGFDASKLSQLKKETLTQGEEALLVLAKKIDETDSKTNLANEEEDRTEIQRLSAEFFKIIPHLPTAHQLPLERQENVDTKFSLLKSLRYIIDAFDVINKTKNAQNFLEGLYTNLRYNITPLEKDTKFYETIKDYSITNSVSPNSILYLEVNNIFECIPREGTETNERKLGNKVLLWYGDRISCYSGILAKGFQYKDKLLNGGHPSFGFSDSVVKAMSACYLDRYDKQAFLLLCEVTLGETIEVESSQDLKNRDTTDIQSVKLKGKMTPSVESKTTLEEDVHVPVGKLEAANKETKNLYNEFLVYNQDQIRLRYIVKFDIKYH